MQWGLPTYICAELLVYVAMYVCTVLVFLVAMSRTTFALVRWVEEESVGVMPLSAVRSGQKAFVSAIVEMKFKSMYYEAEILKISGEYQLEGNECAARSAS